MTDKPENFNEENNLDSENKETSLSNEGLADENQERNIPKKSSSSESNYQISLVNENLLKIKIITDKGVGIDSSVKDKKTSNITQSNKIYLQPKTSDEQQEIEIIISIDSEGAISIEKKKEFLETEEDNFQGLIPNPDVADLINLVQPSEIGEPIPETPEEILEEKLGRKNPFVLFRKSYQRNLAIGIIVAVILHLTAAALIFFNRSKATPNQNGEEQQRLIVIQDLPDPKILLQNIEDLNKPKEEPPPDETEPQKSDLDMLKEKVPPRKIKRPPNVVRPKTDWESRRRDTTNLADYSRELDSLRKLLTSNDTKDTSTKKIDTSKSNYQIPDSLKNNFSEKDIGLAMSFPKNWKLTDQRDINKNEKDFKGVLLTDTTAAQSGTMTLFIFLDKENKDFNSEDFKKEFLMLDSTLSGFYKEPKTLAGFTEYRFYIFNKIGTEKLTIKASTRKQFFDEYKNIIEAVVRSIRIRKFETTKSDSTKADTSNASNQ